MPKILTAPEPQRRVIAPTDTKKLAQRLLSASDQIMAALPFGFHLSQALDILLTLYVADDEAGCSRLNDLMLPGSPRPSLTQRWIDALVTQGLVERRADLMMLSDAGCRTVETLLENLYAAQRELDWRGNFG